MTKEEALDLIDNHKNKLIDPIELLRWTWLRVTILQIPEDEWDEFVLEATVIMTK